jgi:hypothetical protein
VPHAPAGEVLQHDAVVTTNLDHERVLLGQVACAHELGKALEVLSHAHRGGRKERVVLVEHALAIDQLGELRHLRFFAVTDLQLEEVLVGDLLRRQKAVGDGHLPERDEVFGRGAADQTLGHGRSRDSSKGSFVAV